MHCQSELWLGFCAATQILLLVADWRFACGLPQIRRFLILGFGALLGFLPLSH
jgi:hypothetical protein